jgi:alkylation response protein AidB-like acyl-CoA dehydrogenase
VRFDSTPAQDALRARVRSFLAEASPMAEVRRLMETDLGFDPDVWRAMVDEGFVGPGLSFPEQAVVLEEAGAALLCAPLLGTVVAAAAAGDPSLGAGPSPAVVALAVAEDAGVWDEAGVALRATADGALWRLDGHKSFVLDGHAAAILVVAARSDAGLGFFLVDGAAPGLARAPLPTLDLTRRLARLTFEATPARLLGAPGGGGAVLARAMDMAAAALADEQVGGAQRCLDITVEHVRSRVQFGRPIGSFQAVQHRCADMLLEIESARSAAMYAALAAESAPEDLPAAAAMAKATCSDAYAFVAAETIHLHGGVGFTWDHDAHLYFKRAKSSRLLFGDPNHHREQLAMHIGI